MTLFFWCAHQADRYLGLVGQDASLTLERSRPSSSIFGTLENRTTICVRFSLFRIANTFDNMFDNQLLEQQFEFTQTSFIAGNRVFQVYIPDPFVPLMMSGTVREKHINNRTVQRPLYSSFVFTSSLSNPRLLT